MAQATSMSAPTQITALLRSANRSILFLLLSAIVLYSIFVEWLGEDIGSFLAALVGLIVLQLLLYRTEYSPLAVLRRFRGVSVSVVLGLAGLDYFITQGLFHALVVFVQDPTPAVSGEAEALISPLSLGLAALGTVIIVPFSEELILRGAALGAYSRLRSPLFAAVATSLIFAFSHGAISGLAFLPSSFLFALAMLKTGQIWNVIIAHMLLNLFNTISSVGPDLSFSNLPTTLPFGIFVLALAAFLFWLGVRWFGLPKASVAGQEDRRSIWTPSLVVVAIILALISFLSIYQAVRFGLASALY